MLSCLILLLPPRPKDLNLLVFLLGVMYFDIQSHCSLKLSVDFFSISMVINNLMQGFMLNGRLPFSTSSANGTEAASSPSGKNIKPVNKGSESQVADAKILRTLASYLWMKDNSEFRFRVIMALGFLVGAKVWLFTIIKHLAFPCFCALLLHFIFVFFSL